MTNDQIFEFWQAALKINPKITLLQAAALVRRLLAAKRRRERQRPTQ